MKNENTTCTKIQQMILLNDSGELDQTDLHELNLHIRQCRTCSEYSREIKTIISYSRNALPGGMPSENTIHNIVAKAGHKKGLIVFFAHPWRMASGIAALFAVILTAHLILQPPPVPQQGSSALGADELQIMINLASGGELAEPDSSTMLSEEARMKKLAATLLKLQGFAFEDSEDPEDVTDLFLPTALQLHNTPGSPAETSV